jgi:hypothetical protein
MAKICICNFLNRSDTTTVLCSVGAFCILKEANPTVKSVQVNLYLFVLMYWTCILKGLWCWCNIPGIMNLCSTVHQF